MTDDRIADIERALREVGAFGSVELVVENGRVAYVVTKRSMAVRDGRQTELPMT